MLRDPIFKILLGLLALAVMPGCGTEIGNGISFPDGGDGAESGKAKPAKEGNTNSDADTTDSAQNSIEPSGGASPEDEFEEDLGRESANKKSDSDDDLGGAADSVIPPAIPADLVVNGVVGDDFDPLILFAPCRNILDFIDGNQGTLTTAGEVYLMARRNSDQTWSIQDANGVELYTFDGETLSSEAGDITSPYTCNDAIDGGPGDITTYESGGQSAQAKFNQVDGQVNIRFTTAAGKIFDFVLSEP